MEPIIIAAVIAGGSAVLTGAAGFGATAFGIHSARRNVDRGLEAQRERQLWDRRASAYVDTLAHVTHQEQGWENELKRIPSSEATEQAEQERLASFKGPTSFELEARLVAFGSTTFRLAFADWNSRHSRLVEAYGSWREQFSGPPAPFLRRPKELDAAFEAFKTATLDLANVGNRELQAGPGNPSGRSGVELEEW